MRPASTSTADSIDFLITVNDVAQLLCLSTREVWRREAAGKIPKAVRMTKKTVRWKGSEIQAYIDSLGTN